MSKDRKCLFCGDTKLSKEHIFAQWLLKELDLLNSQVVMVHSALAGIPISTREHSFLNLINGLVCEKCNNGWMSKLECNCQPHIINLMNMNEKEIKNEIEYLKTNHITLAKWAFKNAILLNSATNYRDIVPIQHFIDLYNGSIPKNVFIDCGFCKKVENISWRQSQTVLIIGASRSSKDTYIITFQIKNLLFKIAFYNSDQDVFYGNDGVIRIFPEFGISGDFKFFDDIDDFDIQGAMYISKK